MAMIPINSDSENIGVLIIDAQSLDKLIPELIAHLPSGSISSNPLRLSPKVDSGRIIGFDVVKSDSPWSSDEVPGFPPTE